MPYKINIQIENYVYRCMTFGNSPARQNLPNDSGFTLVELLVVVSIIAILSMTVLTSFSNFKNNAKIYRCMQEIRGIEKEITAFSTDKGRYPLNLSEIGRDTLLDPWGQNYIYSAPTRTDVGLTINTDYDIYSKGPNLDSDISINVAASDDDIIRGRDGGFVGMPIDY